MNLAEDIQVLRIATLTAEECILRRLLERWVSGLDPAIAYGPHGEILGLCDADAPIGLRAVHPAGGDMSLYGAERKARLHKVSHVFWLYPARPVERERREVEMPAAPSYKDLAKVLNPLFFMQRHWEHVRVYTGDRAFLGEDHYRDMFVDERGVIDDLPRNEAATALYQRNVLLHEPGQHDPTELPHIAGLAVLFERRVWT